MLLETGEERDERKRRGEQGKRGKGGGRRGEVLILYKNTLELLVSGVLECIEVEKATCAPLYTTVLHYIGTLTG